METKSIDLSIVIINYNTFDLTVNCIKSIKDTTKQISYEIILIDNASKECDSNLFLNIFPEIKLFSLNENVGFGRANNLGMQHANGSYILLLNSDTVVLENTLEDCLDYLKKNTDAHVLGCRSVYPGGHYQMTVFDYQGERSLRGAFRWLLKSNPLVSYFWNKVLRNKVLPNGRTKVYVAEPTSYEELTPNYVNGRRIGSLMGVFLLFHRNIWEETKGFDPDFFMYSEEIEWFMNRLFKYNIVYYPKATIVHYQGKSDIYGKMRLQGIVSLHLFWYKMGYVFYAINLIFSILEIPSRLLLAIFVEDKNQNWFHLKNTWHALYYAFLDIPLYSNKFGARKEMLKIKFLKKRNL